MSKADKMFEELEYKKVEKALDKLEEMYQYYTDCGNTALEKENQLGANLHFAEASAFGRAKWIVEDIFNEE